MLGRATNAGFAFVTSLADTIGLSLRTFGYARISPPYGAKNPLENPSKRDIKQTLRKKALAQQVQELQKEIKHLQLERDILEKAGEIIKKDQGINLATLTNREKAVLIDALRDKYRLKLLLDAMNIAKSSYCYQEQALHAPDKYAELRSQVRKIFDEAHSCYGYRRIHAVAKKAGAFVSEKVIRRIMKDEHLAVSNIRKKKYSSYAGEISPEIENIIDRDFSADTPNAKWLTDITEFSIAAGKVYLSPIIDCFDGMAVSWTIGTSPDAGLVNSMLDAALPLLEDGEYPIIHSDRGCHYRWPGWIERTEKAKLTRSMSKKGCSPDNSACEGFFGRLKNEMFYGRPWVGVSLDDFIHVLDSYLRWYNEKRIKMSLGAKSPLEYRQSLGLTE
jgi:transposase InsO family protein